jgi:hypothetical protein
MQPAIINQSFSIYVKIRPKEEKTIHVQSSGPASQQGANKKKADVN